MRAAESKSSAAALGDRSGERQILTAAENLFADRGYDAVSVAEIAAAAGLSKANIFHHFKSKEALYLTVLKTAGTRATRLVEVSDTTDARERPPLEHLQQHFAHQLAQLIEDPQATRLVLRELLDHGSEHSQELAEQVYASAFARSVGRVRDCQISGELRDDFNPGLLAFLLLAANIFLFQAEPIFRHMDDADFVADSSRYNGAVLELLLRGALAGKD